MSKSMTVLRDTVKVLSFALFGVIFMNVHSWLNALHIIAAIIWIGGIFVMATAAAWCAQAVGKCDGDSAGGICAQLES
jgi:putative copper export protein